MVPERYMAESRHANGVNPNINQRLDIKSLVLYKQNSESTYLQSTLPLCSHAVCYTLHSVLSFILSRECASLKLNNDGEHDIKSRQ